MSLNEGEKPANLDEAAIAFLASLSVAKRETVTPAVMNFVRWYGGNQTLDRLSPPKLAEYAEGQSPGEEGATKLKAVRELLAYATKKEWTGNNLGVHLKAKKSPIRARAAIERPAAIERLVLTMDKQAEMQAEVITLKDRRFHLIEDIKRAAADKDLKENAPYHAAREEKAKIDGKIKELETLLRHAVISEQEHCPAGTAAELGRKITIRDLKTGVATVYTLVTPREVNPRSGRISPVSPIGKAILGRSAGEIVEVIAPACINRYTIECIE